jgi:HEPN domain-containing protein
MATAEAALQKCFIKLHTAVSKIHDIKKLLLQNLNKKKLSCEKKMVERLIKSCNFYFY